VIDDAEEQGTESLTAAAMRGDQPALHALWQEHRRWVAAVLIAYKPQHEDLEDLLQEVAMTLVSKIHTLRDQTNVRAWLRAVAINAARASARTGKSRPRVSLSAVDLDAGIAEQVRGFEPDDEARRVLEMARRLPETYREPLILKAVHGMRARQISQILGIPEATVDTRVSRARRMLREQMRSAETQTTSHLNGAISASEYSHE
jgi:RNA polymerase sigma-70 factor (ECF subfamily)